MQGPNVFLYLLLLIIAIVFIILFLIKQNKPTIPTMLLGIEITLIGGIIAISDLIDLGGIELVVILFGLVITTAGFSKSK